MINRRNTVYYALPEEFTGSKKAKDASMAISINLVLPKELEGKADKLIDEINDEASKMFAKFMKKQIKKHLEKG